MLHALFRAVEYPPTWVFAFMIVMGALARWAPLIHLGDWGLWPGRLLIAAGLSLLIWSALTFRRNRTTVIPRREAETLVVSGPYRYSRNPIYLADLAILIGWALCLGAASPWLFVPFFPIVINRRFILDEEAMLARKFGGAFERYSARVGRWL